MSRSNPNKAEQILLEAQIELKSKTDLAQIRAVNARNEYLEAERELKEVHNALNTLFDSGVPPEKHF